MDFQCLAAHQILFDIFKQHSVTVYGGYLRDVIAGLEPVDIDLIVDLQNSNKLLYALGKLGYSSQFICSNMYLLTHDKLITLDLYIETEFNHNDTILSPVTELDFDVNSLFYYAHGKQYYLGLWQDELDITVEQLVERLQSKDRTAQMQPSCSIPRMAKMIDKGWKVV